MFDQAVLADSPIRAGKCSRIVRFGARPFGFRSRRGIFRLLARMFLEIFGLHEREIFLQGPIRSFASSLNFPERPEVPSDVPPGVIPPILPMTAEVGFGPHRARPRIAPAGAAGHPDGALSDDTIVRSDESPATGAEIQVYETIFVVSARLDGPDRRANRQGLDDPIRSVRRIGPWARIPRWFAMIPAKKSNRPAELHDRLDISATIRLNWVKTVGCRTIRPKWIRPGSPCPLRRNVHRRSIRRWPRN